MKLNISIVATYLAGFVLLNIALAAIIFATPGAIDDPDLILQYSIYGNILFYLVVTFLIVFLFRKYMFEQFKDFFNRMPKTILLGFIGVGVIYFIVIIMGIILTLLGVSDQADNQASLIEMLEAASPFQFAMLITFITVLAPVTEELVFRKGIYGIVGIVTTNYLNKFDGKFTKKKIHLIANIIAILISGIIFGAIHATDIYLLVYGGLGVALGLVYFLSDKNIIVPIITHIVYNTISVVLTLFFLEL